MNQPNDPKPYNLEERAFLFAKRVRAFIKVVPRNITNFEDAKQVVRSSGSVGANYIEATEPLGEKDNLMHLKIARKEAKESKFWLRLLDVGSCQQLANERDALVQECSELMLILNAIIRKKSDPQRV